MFLNHNLESKILDQQINEDSNSIQNQNSLYKHLDSLYADFYICACACMCVRACTSADVRMSACLHACLRESVCLCMCARVAGKLSASKASALSAELASRSPGDDVAKLSLKKSTPSDTMAYIMDIELDSFKISLNAKQEHRFDFTVPDDAVRTSNSLGFARSWRQQCFLNHDRNERKRKLVDMGREAGSSWSRAPMKRAFLIVEVSNKTNQRFDPPNWELTMKDLEDGLVQAGVLEDDNSSVIVGTLFRALETKDRSAAHVNLVFYELED